MEDSLQQLRLPGETDVPPLHSQFHGGVHPVIELFGLLREDGGGDEFVAFFEVEEAYPLGVAADDAQIARSDTDHLSAFRDKH